MARREREWEALDPKLLEAVTRILTRHIGREHAIARADLVDDVRRLTRHPYTDRQVRAAINALRKQGWLICSAGGVGGGYWLAKNRGEVLEFLEREVRPRAMDLLAIEKAMRQAMLEQFGQPTLFEFATR